MGWLKDAAQAHEILQARVQELGLASYSCSSTVTRSPGFHFGAGDPGLTYQGPHGPVKTQRTGDGSVTLAGSEVATITLPKCFLTNMANLSDLNGFDDWLGNPLKVPVDGWNTLQFQPLAKYGGLLGNRAVKSIPVRISCREMEYSAVMWDVVEEGRNSLLHFPIDTLVITRSDEKVLAIEGDEPIGYVYPNINGDELLVVCVVVLTAVRYLVHPQMRMQRKPGTV
jgi:hypothetical protein